MSQLHVNEKLHLSLQAVDANGNPVVVTFDAVQWTNSDESVAKLTTTDQSADLVPEGNAVGKVTTVAVFCTIGGVNFTASVDEAIVAGPVAGVNIVETFSPAT